MIACSSRKSVRRLETIFSIIFEKFGRRDIGRKLSGKEISPPLKIGIILAIYNWLGTIPDSNDLRMIKSKGLARI